jgi:2-haloalkanoic acid dehalogenase type II
MRLTDFKVLTFDCYGTLIDWESGIYEALRPLTSRLAIPLDRDSVLASHARHESQQQLYTPQMKYCDLLAVVYKRIAEEWGVTHSLEEAKAYGQSVQYWPAFPDSTGALQYLKKFFKIAILSNVDNATFENSRKLLGVEFDAVFTAEDIGSYKPAPANFNYMLNALKATGIQKHEILLTAESMFHDHVPASHVGLPTCWIYRRYEKPGYGATIDPGTAPLVDFSFTSMAQLVTAHQDELRLG